MALKFGVLVPQGWTMDLAHVKPTYHLLRPLLRDLVEKVNFRPWRSM